MVFCITNTVILLEPLYNSIGNAKDHYRTGIITTQPALDTALKNRIAMNNKGKNNLIYFLYTLADTTLTKSVRYC